MSVKAISDELNERIISASSYKIEAHFDGSRNRFLHALQHSFVPRDVANLSQIGSYQQKKHRL